MGLVRRPPANGSPSVSIVVAVHGNAEALARLVRALTDQDYAADAIELVLVDNHRQPVVPDELLDAAPFAHVLVHEGRPGLSRARNVGVAHASGEYLLFTDPDARPDRAWVRHLVGALEQTGAYCAGGRTVPRFIGTRGPVLDPGVLRLFVPPVWPERVCQLRPPYWLVGCNLAVRRAPLPRFEEWLGARPGRHLSCEDLELVVRVERDGLEVVVAPDAVVHRAIHAADLRVTAILGRALWHGVSIARLGWLHPGAAIFDSYRVRDALRMIRPMARASWLAALADLCRIVGLAAERSRLVCSQRRSSAMDRHCGEFGNGRQSSYGEREGRGDG